MIVIIGRLMAARTGVHGTPYDDAVDGQRGPTQVRMFF
jgi:hypothetical protein